MGFVAPWVWWFGVPLLVLLGFGLFRLYKRSLLGVPVWFTPAEVRRYHPTPRLILRTGAVLFGVLALTGPYFQQRPEGGQVIGRQVFFLLDVSASMRTSDVQPNRLERARGFIREVAQRLSADQLGLIVFTEYGYVQCPLTDDPAAFALFLDLISPEQFANSGTNYRAALSLAFNQFAAEVNRKQVGMAQAVVLLSDGEHFGPAFASVIGRMQSAGIALFPVGVGSEQGGRVPNVDEEGRPQGYLRDESGQTVISRLEDTTLRELSDEFGTPYLRLTQTESPTAQLARLIHSLPASVIDTREGMRKLDRYAFFLFPALLCWAMSVFLIPQRRVASH